MSDKYYPPNPTLHIRVLHDNRVADPTYLANAPYPPDDITFLETLLKRNNSLISDADGSGGGDGGFVFGAHTDRYTTISEQAELIYNEMASFRSSPEFKTATIAERNGLLRTMTQLLEKLVNIDERAKGLKYVSDFQNTMLEIIEDILNPDQRTEVMERLRNVRQDAPRSDELELEGLTEINE